MSSLPSVCPLDCPDSCSLEVTVQDDRVVRINGGARNPVTAGFICAKVRRFPEAVYGKDRVREPLRRIGAKGEGRFELLSWDEALDEIANRFEDIGRRFGAEAILPLSYGGSNGFLSQDTTDARWFRRMGASRLARTVCAAPTGAAAAGLYGKMPGTGYEDYAGARMIIVWGANPHATGVHLLPYVQQAMRQGAKLVVVDPRRTKLAARADLHLALKPGTDLPVALALLNWFFANGHADSKFLGLHAAQVSTLQERASEWSLDRAAEISGLEAADLEGVARWYAESTPAVLRCGWGLERNRNGGSAVAAVLALPAVAGKFGVRGGGYTLSNSAAWGLSSAHAAAEPEAATRVINMNRVGRALCGEVDPPIMGMFVYNANPLMTLPNQSMMKRGMAREDLFTVVFDSFLTDSAVFADIVLPATTFLERRELARGYGAYALQRSAPVVKPVGHSRTNHEVFLELCERMGFSKEGDPRTETEVEAVIMNAHPSGDTWTRALDGGQAAVPDFGTRPVQFVDVFPGTEDGRIHLVPPHLDAEAPGGLYFYREEPSTGQFPLALISPASGRLVSSTLGQLHQGPWPVLIHPEDAGNRGIVDKGEVRVFNDGGEVRCPARVTDEVRPGVVSLAKGLWMKHTRNGSTSNVLCPDTLTDIGGGACFNDARVEVEPVTSEGTV